MSLELYKISNLSEPELIEELKSDNKEKQKVALYMLLEKFSKYILVIANKYITIPESDFPELRGELYERLSKSKKIDKIHNFKSYLAKCVRFTAIDRLRKQQLKFLSMQNEDFNNVSTNNDFYQFFTTELLDKIHLFLTEEDEKVVFNAWRRGDSNTKVAKLIGAGENRRVEVIKQRIKRKVLKSFEK